MASEHSLSAFGHQRFAAGAFPRRLLAWREGNNLSQREAALKLQISKRTLQEWEQDRTVPRGFARTAVEKPIATSADTTTALCSIELL